MIQIVKFRNDILIVIIQKVGHSGDDLTCLVWPTRSIPLASWLTHVEYELFKIVFVRRLICTQSKFTKQMRGVQYMSPCLAEFVVIAGKIIEPGNHSSQ